MIETIDNELAEVERLREERAGEYQDLVRSIAQGEKVTAAFIDATLTKAGKTPGDLRADLSRMTKRLALRAQMDAKPVAEKALAEFTRQLEAINQQLRADINEAERRHQEAAGPIQQGLREAREALAAAGEAERDLISGASDELKSSKREAELDANRWENSIHETRKQLHAAAQRRAIELDHAKRALAAGKGDAADVERLTKVFERTQADIAAHNEAERRHVDKQQRIFQEMLTP